MVGQPLEAFGQPSAAFGKLEMLPGCHQGSLGTYAPSNNVSVPVFVYLE